MAEHNELGKLGEEMAIDFLRNNGYEILDINWRFQNAELDIICKIDNIIAVVEVKTRTSLEFGLPQEAITPKKIKLLTKALNEYLCVKNIENEARFDIISIHKEAISYVIEHITDAFYHF